MTSDQALVEGKEALSLLIFGTNGHVEWSSSLSSPVNGSTLAKLVKVFLASLSISDALLVSKQKNTSSNLDQTSDNYGLPKATVLHGDDNTLLICSPKNKEKTEWIALLGKPLAIENIQTLDAILPSFRNAARFLMPQYSENKTKTQKLWFHMRQSYATAFWTEHTRFSNGRNAILTLTNSYLSKLRGSDTRLVLSLSDLGLPVKEGVESFSRIVFDICGREVLKRICVFSKSSDEVYGEGVNGTESEFCEWYYHVVINVGTKRFHKHLVEANGDGIVRILAQYYEWFIYADFVISIDFEAQQIKALRQTVYDLIRKVSESKR